MRLIKHKIIDDMTKEAICARHNEFKKYDMRYYDIHYWAEDIPNVVVKTKYTYNDPGHLNRFTILANSITNVIGGCNKLLDVGCGTGLFINKMNNNCKYLFGIDPSKYAIKKARYNVNISKNNNVVLVQGEARMLPFNNNMFDAVCCFDVLEHIPCFDVYASIKEICRVSNRFIILSINMDNPYDYHPTILPRNEWNTIITNNKGIKEMPIMRHKIEMILSKSHREYSIFCYKKESK